MNDAVRVPLLVALFLFVELCAFAAPAHAKEDQRPNIVVIVLDDVGYSDVGAFGSEIRTPAIDGIASDGLRYNRFDTKAVCSPTRAALLTGRNPQTVRMADLPAHKVDPNDFTRDRGELAQNAQTVAQVLQRAGYETFGFGKWHLAPETEDGSPGSNGSWPLQRGFDQFYGFFLGWTDQYHPELIEGNRRVAAPATEGYHFSADITDRAIAALTSKPGQPRKPAFVYLAYGAAHSPIQVPKPYIDAYAGVYDKGWDALRESRLARMKQLGIVPANTVLPPRNPGDRAWSDLTPVEKQVFARFMQVYAGFITHTDEQIGRLVAHLKATGQYENTLIVFLSDNGAASEAGQKGSFEQLYRPNTLTPEQMLARLDEVGSDKTQSQYQRPWAMAGVTPFRRYKLWPHLGGIRTPLIVSWPAAIKDGGAIRKQYVDAVDIAPTLVDAAGTRFPTSLDGRPEIPVAGKSIRASFTSANAPSARTVQYFELRGNRAITSGRWRAVAVHKQLSDFETDRWELYDTETDFSESTDLAARYPKKVEELKRLWWSEARKYSTPPLAEAPDRFRLRERFDDSPDRTPLPPHLIPPPQPTETAHRRSNVIFVLVDDLRFDGMGFLQPGLKTPNIDRLARGGSYFPNTVVTSALCSPSRATILTGQTARNHTIVDNNDASEEGLVFFPSYLQKAGYQTAFIGKWHMGQSTDSPRPGFDKWVSFKGQGAYYPTTGLPEAAVKAGRVNMLNVDGREVPQKGYITDELTEHALQWLDRERDRNKPFFLYLSHKAVHSDPLPAPRHAGQYDDFDFKIPASAANTPENYAGKPLWVYNQRNTWHGIDFFYNSDMKMTEYLRYYYSTLSAVDDSLGRLLAWLKKNRLEQDTLVVFTSDNGFLIGEHGLIDKRNAYQPSVRVPMVIYQPGTVPAGVTNPGRVRNLDFAPTFLELAGVPSPPQFEGRSAWPLINGRVPPADWKPQDFVYEYYWEWTFPMTPGTFAIQRGDLKYIQYYGVYDTDELYDLSKDPDEMRNLIDDPAYLDAKIELRAALYQQLADRNGRHVIPYTQRLSIGSVRRNREGTGAAPYPEQWLVEPNRLDRLDDVLPDSRAKQSAHDRGQPLLPMPVVGRGGNSVEGAAQTR